MKKESEKQGSQRGYAGTEMEPMHDGNVGRKGKTEARHEK